MNIDDFRALYELEETYWWFVGMRGITRSILVDFERKTHLRVLDAGCGTGIMLKWLERYSAPLRVVGVDLSLDALAFCRRRGHKLLSRASLTALPFAAGHFDLITSFDVFQFLPAGSDRFALRELHRVLKPNGTLFLRVASYEWLRAGHDAAQGACHRYHLRELREKVEQAGFHVERTTYVNTWLFPVALAKRLLQKINIGPPGADVKPLPGGLTWMNNYLAGILMREGGYLSKPHRTLPFGLSLICLARKY